jgi:hypothetical protein
VVSVGFSLQEPLILSNDSFDFDELKNIASRERKFLTALSAKVSLIVVETVSGCTQTE